MVAGRGFQVRVVGFKKVAGFEKVAGFQKIALQEYNEEQNLRVNANFRKVKFTFIYLINANLRVFIRTISQ